MPFSIIVPRFVIDESWRFTKKIKMGHRNDGSDGNAEQQLVGVIGQNMVNLALCKPLMEHDTGFDGGVDFEAFGMRFAPPPFPHPQSFRRQRAVRKKRKRAEEFQNFI